MTAVQALRCGRIDYTNDLPVYTAFDEDAVEFPGTMYPDTPAALNRALLAGELDCSPISSAAYAEHAEQLVLLPRICIGSRAEVRSICCISDRPLTELAESTVVVTDQSATGRALFATICSEWYGFTPHLQTASDPFEAYIKDRTPCVLIGDAAIDASFQVPAGEVYDLGRLWHERSGEQMVYAVWAVREQYARQNSAQVDALWNALMESVQWGVEHHRTVIDHALEVCHRPQGFYESYFDALKFDFDDDAQHGLKRFFDLACAHRVLSQSPMLRFYEAVATRV